MSCARVLHTDGEDYAGAMGGSGVCARGLVPYLDRTRLPPRVAATVSRGFASRRAEFLKLDLKSFSFTGGGRAQFRHASARRAVRVTQVKRVEATYSNRATAAVWNLSR
jgi:hypothetical protein